MVRPTSGPPKHGLINYLDTANAYGPSQVNYGEAFRRLHLTPTDTNYDLALRERLYLATKTGCRFALDPAGAGPTAVDELKRSLTYEVRAGNKLLLSLPFRAQMYETPLSVSLPASAIANDAVTVVASEAPPRTVA
ncbi:MAG: hypothetical protein ACLQVN_14275 [Bryobacteraceae bacterium]